MQNFCFCNFVKFSLNFERFKIQKFKIYFVKISKHNINFFATTLCRSGVKGAGRYSPWASFALTQIVPYSSSLYTVFHSVIYNSVVCSIVHYLSVCITAVVAGRERLGECFIRKMKGGGLSVLRVIYILWLCTLHRGEGLYG